MFVASEGMDITLEGGNVILKSISSQNLCPQCRVNAVPKNKTYCSHDCYSSSRRHTPETFWNRIEKTEGCWIWHGDTQKYGYGRLNYHRKLYLAHRLAWILTNGPIPKGKYVLHRCDNPPCCNPDHLYIGTPADNVRDMIERNRMARGDSKHVKKGLDHYYHKTPEKRLRGERHGMSKLNEAAVLSIRDRFARKEASAIQLGKEYGVDRSLIYMVAKRQIWSHV